jgi:predicted Zn-ribbon and HTH transcriptional regulator
MDKPKRALIVPRDSKQPGTCSVCGHQFKDPNMLKKFEAHKCKEDASQAAARIVREATENR